MKIVLLGFDFECPNKGCEALSYAFVSMLQRIFQNERLEIHNVTHKDGLGVFPQKYPDIKFVHHRASYKSLRFFGDMVRWNRAADLIFDITYGDSFSDIYGKKWLIKTNIYKQLAVWSKTPFVLLPQTYGPYEDLWMKKWSLSLIRHSDKVYSRDQISCEYVKTEGNKQIKAVTDLAFALPFDTQMYQIKDNGQVKVGVNVSSLLWEGGFTKDNQFGLKVDYQEYCRCLIGWLLESGNYEVHLISHVIEDREGAPENDLRPCRILGREFPKAVIAPGFETPIEAKSYISRMDVFTGARMHATIGAFSSGVATIPFSYSRKFEGLYGNLDYPYVIAGKSLTTAQALELTIDYIERRKELKDRAQRAMAEIKARLALLEQEIAHMR